MKDVKSILFVGILIVFYSCKESHYNIEVHKYRFSDKELSLLFDSSEAAFISIDTIPTFTKYIEAKKWMYDLWSERGHGYIIRPTVILKSVEQVIQADSVKAMKVQLRPLYLTTGGGTTFNIYEKMSLGNIDDSSFLFGIKTVRLTQKISRDSLINVITSFFIERKDLWYIRDSMLKKRNTFEYKPFNWETKYQPEIWLPMYQDSLKNIATTLETIAIAYLLSQRANSVNVFGKIIDSLSDFQMKELRHRLPLNISLRKEFK